MMKLEGRVAIVTGGGSGIGRAISLLFAREGAQMVVADIDGPAAKMVTEEIEDKDGQGIPGNVDVANSEEINAVVQDVLGRWGTIDILVNCAGIGSLEWFIEGNEREWDRIIAVNLKGTILFTHAVLPSMIERRYGKIINVSSGAGKVGAARHVVHSASKGGVIAFTKALAREVARYKININDICPGPIDTSGFEQGRQSEPEHYAKLEQGIPWKRVGQPTEVAAAALFLAADDSEYITGQSLSVDGGMTMV